MELPDPIIQEHEGVVVVRDDLLPGGTKRRVVPLLFSDASEYVYASPVYGYAQVALAHAARDFGKNATVFCAMRKNRHPRTLEAAAAGARIVEVPVGYLSVVQARAREYCAITGSTLLPFGLDVQSVREGLAAIAQQAIQFRPTEVWTVAGSGTLSRALQDAWPAATFHAVRVGAVPLVGGARLYQAPERFESDASVLPPFPSCLNYDAKAWRFVRQLATPGALFWNVAA